MRWELMRWIVPIVAIGAAPGAGLTLDAEERIVARINGEEILAKEVERELKLAKAFLPQDPLAKERLQKTALDQVIDRRLALAHLKQSGEAASERDVDLALAQFEQELKAQNLTLDQHCQRVGLTKEDMRQSLSWKVSWKRYCEKQLTPANLKKYFSRHARDFDGTQLRVAQILFKLAADADEQACQAALDKAAKLREEILAGKTTFDAAAKAISEAPSGPMGGDIGWIERRRPMPEDFSKAAFALKKGEVGQPLVSPFGVHLLTVLEEKPGHLTWRDVERELRPAVTLYLFRWIADKERQATKIEYLPAAR